MSNCFCHLSINDTSYEVKDAKARPFNTIGEIKARTNLVAGNIVRSIGYHNANDGGGATYIIREKLESDVEDNGLIHFLVNGLVAELVIENNSVNVKQFGAKGDGTTDDTTAIKNCFNYANTKSIKVLFDKADYVVSSSIYVADKVSIDGRKATIIPIAGTYTQNCIFLLNTQNGTSWVNAYGGNATIENIDFNNKNKIEIKAFLLAQGNTKFENIITTSMYGLLTTPSLYLDNVQVLGCRCSYSLGTDYMIDKKGQGEGVLIQNCHFANDSEEYNAKAISVRQSMGLEINNLINGDVYLLRCSNTSINNAHLERGSLKLQDCVVSINDSYIWKRDGVYPIELIDSDSRDNYGNSNIVTLTSLKNVIFQCRYADYSYTSDSYDIFAEKYQKDIDVENCYRRSEPVGATYNRMALTGIHIKTKSKELKPQFDKYRILGSKLFTNDNSVCSSTTQSASLLTSVADDSKVTGSFENATYYYKAMLLMDTQRLIKGQTSNEKSITKSTANGTRIGLNLNHEIGCLLRIYRGTTSGSYDKYVDIPNVKNNFLYDNGNTVNGFAWMNRDAGDVDTAGYSQTIELTNKYNENVKVYFGATPNQGTWKKGDIIINNNPTAGGVYGWICITEGTPGTWKAISTIAS